MNNAKEGEGIVEKKEEGITKNGKEFWKFAVNGKTYTQFDYEAGKNVKIGGKVKMRWTETKKDHPEFGPVTYRNLISIEPEDAYKEKSPEELAKINEDVNKAAGKPAAEKEAAKPQIPQSVWEAKDRRMARESAIKSACKILPRGAPAKEILELAKEFEDWIYR